jgi:hypothetical protein
MKKQNEMVAAAAQQLSYEAPRVDVYEIQVERGFQESGTPEDNNDDEM